MTRLCRGVGGVPACGVELVRDHWNTDGVITFTGNTTMTGWRSRVCRACIRAYRKLRKREV